METKEQIRISLSHVLGWGIPILLATAGGVFALTKFSVEQNVDALRTQLDTVKQRARDAEATTQMLKNAQSSSYRGSLLPSVTIDAAGDGEMVKGLAKKISDLEMEREQLIQQLSQNAVASLDPNSELPGLLKQLSSERMEARKEAVTGLFVLKDPRSYASLVTYFTHSTEEGAMRYGHSIWDWYDLLFQLNPQATLELLVNTLDIDDEYVSSVAYSRLSYYVTSVKLIDTCMPYLESLALRSMKPSARTRAKVLITMLSDKRDEFLEKERKSTEVPDDPRSQKEILLRIERILTSITMSEPNQTEPGASTEPGGNWGDMPAP